MGRRPGSSGVAVFPRHRGVAIAALLLSFFGQTAFSTPLADGAEFGPPVETQFNDEPTAAALPPIERRPIGPATENETPLQPGAVQPSSSQFDSSRTIIALAVVIALIFAVRWGLKKAATRVGGMASQLGPGGRAPSGVLSVLARYPVGRGQSFVLLQIDQRVLLLNQAQDGFRPLAEITDPEEVASLIIKTRDEESDSLASKFTSLLKGFERDPQIVSRNEWPSRNPTTVDAALRLFPAASAERNQPADPLAAVRRRIADLDGGAA